MTTYNTPVMVTAMFLERGRIVQRRYTFTPGTDLSAARTVVLRRCEDRDQVPFKIVDGDATKCGKPSPCDPTQPCRRLPGHTNDCCHLRHTASAEVSES